ncbi:MAG: hypothetical protein J5802_00005 [Butyrivibrio sp.]|nr:hypothetical protein [Butyrivibrio sp.]
MKKKNITAICITLLILLIIAGCSQGKSLDAKSGITDKSGAEEKSDMVEFYSLDAGDTVYSINEKGEKVGEFHDDKIKEILGLDDKDDDVRVLTYSDKIAICRYWNSKLDECSLYAVNERSGRSTELKKIPGQVCDFDVDYYKGDFYFTYDDKELICSIKDNLEYDVKKADLGDLFDKISDKTIGKFYKENISITQILDDVGYVIAYDSDSSKNGYVMVKKDGTVTALPQLDGEQHGLMCYDKNGIIYKECYDYYDLSTSKVYCIKLGTMEENEISGATLENSTFYTLENGKLYWSSISEQEKSTDIWFTKTYYAYDVESNTVSVLTQTNVKTDMPPELACDISVGDLRVCGDHIFIKDAAEEQEKWFRIDKEGENTVLTDIGLNIKTVTHFDLAAYTWDKPILVLHHDIYCPIDIEERGCYPEIILCDEEKNKHPKFAKYIEAFNTKYKDETYEYLGNHGKKDEGDRRCLGGYKDEDGRRCLGLHDSSYLSASFSRVDEHFVTIVLDEYSDGGAHPNFGSRIFNVNLETGKEIELSQIVNDYSRLVEAFKKECNEDERVLEYLTELYNSSVLTR